MLDRWVGTKVDLKLLSENLVQFFEKKGFSSVVDQKSSNEYRVIAVPGRASDILGTVSVSIRGELEGLVIEFAADSGSGHFRGFLGFFATLFGGGVLVLKDLKSQEELERLEREFWLFVDKKIDSLSAANSKR